MAIPSSRETPPDPGLLEPGLRRVLANNPSPMTFRGTNTYLIGETEIAVIDPGPADEAHLAAILWAVPKGARITRILVTHSHCDHSALAPALAQATGAPVLAFGPSGSGARPATPVLAALMPPAGAGLDLGFVPDQLIGDGETLAGEGWSLTAIWTPGHLGNHVCFAWGDRVFTGDHVMAWSTSVISPPEGDMGQYRAALSRLAQRQDRRHYPGHGPPIDAPTDRVRELVQHRAERSKEVLAQLASGPATTATLARRIYRDIPAGLLAAATRNVLAHLLEHVEHLRVAADNTPFPETMFRLA